MSYTIWSASNPTAYITTKKSRLKQFNDSVYLENESNFEIELFNPKSTPVLAKIKINGEHISQSGLIIQPGQRAFLDRYIDVSRLFKFSIYEVDKSNNEVRKAIEKNGLVQVEFYDTVTPPPVVTWITSGNTWYNNNPNLFYSSTGNLGTSISTGGFDGTVTTNYNSNATSGGAGGTSYTSAVGSATKGFKTRNKVTLDDLNGLSNNETGRIGIGGASDQEFISGSGNFNSWYSSMTSWKLLPKSQEPVSINDLKVYCGDCGRKIKHTSDVYCSACGHKLI